MTVVDTELRLAYYVMFRKDITWRMRCYFIYIKKKNIYIYIYIYKGSLVSRKQPGTTSLRGIRS